MINTSRLFRTNAQLTLMLWLAVLSFIAPAAIFAGQVQSFGEALTLLTGTVTGLIFAALLYAGYVRIDHLRTPLKAAAGMVLVAIAATLQTAADFGSQEAVRALLHNSRTVVVDGQTVLLTTVIYMAIYACNFAIFWIVSSANRVREGELDLARAQAAAARFELDKLRLQLNPHFLGNALGGVSSLIATGRAGEAGVMADRLAHFLYATLDDGNDLAPLGDEFDTVSAYLDVEEARFGTRLVRTLDLQPGMEDIRVPPFILQPIVENAVRYAVEPAARPVKIEVEARQEGDRAIIEIRDDGDETPGVALKTGHGVGLKNVRERLRLSFGQDATLEARRTPSGFLVRLVVPVGQPPA